MRTFLGKYQIDLIFWLLVVPLIILMTFLLTSNSYEAIHQSDITIDRVDQDGTIWVTIDGKEYYLYMDDNGVQKRLEMK